MNEQETGRADLGRLRISDHRRSRGRRLYPLLGWLFALAVAAYLLRDRWLPNAGAFLAPEVEVGTVELVAPEAAPPGSLTANGYVVAQRKAELAPKVAGKLLVLNVVEGSRVEKGEVLAQLEKNDLDAQLARAQATVREAESELARAAADRDQTAALVAEAQDNAAAAAAARRETEAALADAQREFDRASQLLASGAGTQGDFDRAKAALDQAKARQVRTEALEASSLRRVTASQAQLAGGVAAIGSAQARVEAERAGVDLLDAQIEYLTIRAPFAGVVIEKNAEIGEIVAPISGGAGAKVAVVTVVDMESLMVEAEVSEAYIRRVAAGQPARITVDAFPDESFPGKVFQVVPTANRQKATVQVKVAFDQMDPRIVPEMAARVFFLDEKAAEAGPGPRTPRTWAPSAALRADGTVWLLDGDHVTQRAVRVGERREGRVEVIEGLAPGDRVVVAGGEGLREGDRVKVARKGA